MSVNSDGSVSSTTGHVEDATAAKLPVKPSEPEEEISNEPVVDENGNLIDPETGEIIGTVTETEPEATDPDGSTAPGTGESVTPPDSGTTTPPDSGTAEPVTPETPAESGAETGTGEPEPPAEPEIPAEGADFTIIEPPPAA